MTDKMKIRKENQIRFGIALILQMAFFRNFAHLNFGFALIWCSELRSFEKQCKRFATGRYHELLKVYLKDNKSLFFIKRKIRGKKLL
ncbi:hypothetical protein HX13_19805 [Chryseobacterium sp. P1-3]|nr:hypothetical protein HX13_19805 [Chryseobacterium sp. P1-3]